MTDSENPMEYKGAFQKHNLVFRKLTESQICSLGITNWLKEMTWILELLLFRQRLIKEFSDYKLTGKSQCFIIVGSFSRFLY